jgi:hypothetical protein
MTTDRITWYPAGKPKRSGMLEHKFTASGPNAQEVWDWLAANNAHGEWLLPQEPVSERFVFRIHENPQDAEAATITRRHITHLKLSAAGGVPYLEWHEHGRA